MSESHAAHFGLAATQIYQQTVSSNHFQLCQNLQVDLSDPVSARGDRLYFVERSFVGVLDRVNQHVSMLANCHFAPQSIDVRYRQVAVCGNGDQLLVLDAYTGATLFHRRPRGMHLTNCSRLFCPPIVGSGVRINSTASPAAPAVPAALSDADENDKVLAAKRSALHSKELLWHLIDDWHDARVAPAMHLLVGGNTDGVVVYSINDGGAAIASLPFPTYINEIRVSPDSTQFVALGDTDDIFFVDIICTHGTASYARRCKREFEPPTPAHHPHPGGFSAAWSSDSKRVAVLRESPGVVNVLDVATLDVLGVLYGEPGEPLRVVAYDDQFVALAELRGNIWIYDAKTFAVCQRIDLLQLHARVWNSVVPSSEMVVFADKLDSPENVARADKYLREHRDNNGASGEFLPAAVRYARYVQARKSGMTRRTPFDNRCHGMVLVPGMLIVGRPNIVVLHARRVPTLAAVASAFVVACRRADHENDRRLVLYDWCVRVARRLVQAHNDVIQRARRRRIAAATERYEAQQLSSSTSTASPSTRSDSAGLLVRVPSQSRRLQAAAFAGASLSSSRANLLRTPRARTTDDIDTDAMRVRHVPTLPRVVGLANPMQSATTVPLLDFELTDVLAFRDMHRVLLSRFAVAFWQVTADDFVMYNKVGDIVATCLRMLSNCIVHEQAAERFEGSPCLPPSTAAPSSATSTITSTNTSTTNSANSSATNSYAGSSNNLLLASQGRALFEAWGRHRSLVQLLQPPPTSATSTQAEVPQPPPLPSPTTRQRTLEAIRAPDDFPARMTVAEALEQLAPLVLLPQCDIDLSGLSRSMRSALQRAASTTHCSAPYVTYEAVNERNVVASEESDGDRSDGNDGSDDEIQIQLY